MKPEHEVAEAVAQKLLGDYIERCKICNAPIRKHSLGNYYHDGYQLGPWHTAEPMEWWMESPAAKEVNHG